MRLDTPLDDFFLNRSHVRVLRAIHGLPEGFTVSGRELARRAGITHPTALKALALLVDAGVVQADRGLAGDAYQLNREHIFSEHLTNLFNAEAAIESELVAFLREHLLAATRKIESATLFGSAVWGESRPGSDIDIAIACSPEDEEDVERALDKVSGLVQRRYGNRLSPLMDSGKKKARPAIWRRIDNKGVSLIRSGKRVSS